MQHRVTFRMLALPCRSSFQLGTLDERKVNQGLRQISGQFSTNCTPYWVLGLRWTIVPRVHLMSFYCASLSVYGTVNSDKQSASMLIIGQMWWAKCHKLRSKKHHKKFITRRFRINLLKWLVYLHLLWSNTKVCFLSSPDTTRWELIFLQRRTSQGSDHCQLYKYDGSLQGATYSRNHFQTVWMQIAFCQMIENTRTIHETMQWLEIFFAVLPWTHLKIRSLILETMYTPIG